MHELIRRTLGLGCIVAALSATAFAVDARGKSLDCITEQKYQCDRNGCRGADPGFVEAERYRLEESGKLITACLWSACYSGATADWSQTDRQAAGTARLTRENGDGVLLLTFTLSTDDRFSAAYSTGGEELSVAFGRCSKPDTH